jgi:hypothetical protein
VSRGAALCWTSRGTGRVEVAYPNLAAARGAGSALLDQAQRLARTARMSASLHRALPRSMICAARRTVLCAMSADRKNTGTRLQHRRHAGAPRQERDLPVRRKPHGRPRQGACRWRHVNARPQRELCEARRQRTSRIHLPRAAALSPPPQPVGGAGRSVACVRRAEAGGRSVAPAPLVLSGHAASLTPY